MPSVSSATGRNEHDLYCAWSRSIPAVETKTKDNDYENPAINHPREIGAR